jgi:hypothetical protein
MKIGLALLAPLLGALQSADPKPPAPDPFVLKVCDSISSRATSLIAKAAAPKTTLEDALLQAAKIDEAMFEEVAEKLSVSPDQVREAWKKRERKSRKASFGSGSWVVLGGQDGGLDSSAKGIPPPEENLLPPGPSILTRRKPPPPAEPVPLGKPLKTKEEWWTSAPSSQRIAHLEAEYARKSTLVDKKEETKKCTSCNGKGTSHVSRLGNSVVIVCGRCHGAKEDLIIVFE